MIQIDQTDKESAPLYVKLLSNLSILLINPKRVDNILTVQFEGFILSL